MILSWQVFFPVGVFIAVEMDFGHSPASDFLLQYRVKSASRNRISSLPVFCVLVFPLVIFLLQPDFSGSGRESEIVSVRRVFFSKIILYIHSLFSVISVRFAVEVSRVYTGDVFVFIGPDSISVIPVVQKNLRDAVVIQIYQRKFDIRFLAVFIISKSMVLTPGIFLYALIACRFGDAASTCTGGSIVKVRVNKSRYVRILATCVFLNVFILRHLLFLMIHHCNGNLLR